MGWLCGFAFLAGLVDSVVGGGGLIQLPALFLFLPSPAAAVIPTVLGSNKMSSICGTGMAVVQYARRIRLPWPSLWPAAGAALVCSFAGARAVTLIQPAVLEPLVLGLMVAVAVYTFVRKDLGSLHAPHLDARSERWLGLGVGAVIGFYDGFFGPGTGSFLIFAYIGLFGFDFLRASASAKVINFATNLSALAYFAATDHILYRYALPMGLCNILGAIAGTRLAILRGNRFVRALFLIVVTVMILRFAWDVLRPA
ncbi:MAG: sulfite exporter TauE/SafE family protein [Verrucomicrobia bacterium]|nr:sulfite exporter TauE/SafE family protein [Verrucomicrobiota bacterium]